MSKKQSGQRKSLLTGASVLAAAAATMAGAPAMAQDSSASDDEAIVVTGTRLVRQDFEAISPVTTVGAETIELTGTLNTETLLNDLPQVVAGATVTANNIAGEDFSTIDLRGLGTNRTLVLVNGERVPAASTLGSVDINTIPAGLISRVEIVSGGASAVYGSDAMGGVVNFVLKDDYEGAELTATYGAEMGTGNVPQFDMNLLLGGNFANGRGNMTFYADYYNRQGVFQSEYDYARISGAVCINGDGHRFVCDSNQEALDAIASGGGVLVAGGSGTPPWGWIATITGNAFKNLSTLLPSTFGAGNTDTNCDGVAGGAINSGQVSFDDSGNLTPRYNTNATACLVPDRENSNSSRYSFAPANYLIIPAERLAVAGSGHYDINDNMRLNYLMSYSNSRQTVQLAATPATNLTVTMTPTMRTLISLNHPDLYTALTHRGDGANDGDTSDFAPFIVNYRTTQVGNRAGHNTNNEFYSIFSLDGQLGDNWDWSLSFSYGQSEFLSRQENSINRTGIAQGLAGCTQSTPGTDGIIGTADDGETPLTGLLPGCVPLDFFGPNNLSAAAMQFLRVTTFSNNIIEENRVAGFVRGNLFQLPAGPLSTVFGFEYRDTQGEFFVDAEQAAGNIFGFNAIQDRRGQIDVYEIYTEFAIPLLSEQPFAYYLGLEGGYRVSNYSSSGNVETWKLGGEWAPASWLRFRGIYNVATRAPSIFELFRNGDQGFTGYTDPCNDIDSDGIPDGAGTPIPVANCTAGVGGAPTVTGWTTGFQQNNVQVQVLAFGNSNLAPETADTYTIGAVFQPDWFPVGDLRLTVDYYHITIAGFITGFGANQILQSCYGIPGALVVPGACGRITRDPNTGQVSNINVSIANLTEMQQSGWDVQAEWSLPLGPGQLTVNELWTKLDEFVLNGVDFAGYGFGGVSGGPFGGVATDQRSVFSLTYALGDWTFLGRWTWQAGFHDASAGGAGQMVPDSSYIDLSARWNLTDNFSVTGVVQNVLDDYPEQYPGATVNGQANTNPVFYRALGRTYTISGRLRF